MSEQDRGLERELGISRRQLIKRGAIVGGTLAWAAPLIQSVGPSAMAAMGRSPGQCGCCYCFNSDNGINPATGTRDECSFNGTVDIRTNRDECQRACSGKGYDSFQYCSGTEEGDCVCLTKAAAQRLGADAGCNCSS